MPSHVCGYGQAVIIGIAQTCAYGLRNTEVFNPVVGMENRIVRCYSTINACIIVDEKIFFHPNIGGIAISHAQPQTVFFFYIHKILGTGGQIDTIDMKIVMDNRVVVIAFRKGGIGGVRQCAEHIRGIQSDRQALADAEGVAPIKLVQATISRILIRHIPDIVNGSAIHYIITDRAERDHPDAGTPVAGHRQPDGYIARTGIRVLLGQIVLLQRGEENGSPDVSHK